MFCFTLIVYINIFLAGFTEKQTVCPYGWMIMVLSLDSSGVQKLWNIHLMMERMVSGYWQLYLSVIYTTLNGPGLVICTYETRINKFSNREVKTSYQLLKIMSKGIQRAQNLAELENKSVNASPASKSVSNSYAAWGQRSNQGHGQLRYNMWARSNQEHSYNIFY